MVLREKGELQMSKKLNPPNVPDYGGNLSFTRLEPISAGQVMLINSLFAKVGVAKPRRLEISEFMLGGEFEGEFENLSKAAGIFLIDMLKKAVMDISAKQAMREQVRLDGEQ